LVTGSAPPLGIGVIGARSTVATLAVMPAIDDSPDTRLIAAAARSGPVPERWSHLDVGSYDDVIAHPEVEAVYVPLPNAMHREWVERVAAAGKHVLCEKPLAVTAADARAMQSACDAAGVLLVEAWMTPYDPRWAHAVGLAASGRLGELTGISADFTFTISASAADNYRWDPEHGGGALLDVGIYCLGPAVELWGDTPDTVEASMVRSPSGVDSSTDFVLRWRDGRHASARCSFVDPEAQRLEITGSEATLTLDADAHTGGAAAQQIRLTGADGSQTILDVSPGNPYLGMVTAFARAIRHGEPVRYSIADSIRLAGLIDRVRAADHPTGATGATGAEAGR
jgi:D-xylose 1-dehydrogenase (NADP+, D-xylono-1,5-lactone-forming)